MQGGGNRYNMGFPRTRQLTAGATIVPEPTASGWHGRMIRQRDKDGTVGWEDDDEEEEDEEETDNGLHYDPSAPPGHYYVLPSIYTPSQAEVQETYAVHHPVTYGSELYHNQFYTDVRNLNASEADDDDARLYYRDNFRSLAIDSHPPFVEISSFRSPKPSLIRTLITEPDLVQSAPHPSGCRNEMGCCSCASRRAEALGNQRKEQAPASCCSPAPPPKVANAPKEVKTCEPPPCPVTKSTCHAVSEDQESLYISVDTHTDASVVESKSIQTTEKPNTCCATQTSNSRSSTESFHSAKSVPQTPVKKSCGGKRMYPILNGRRKSEEDTRDNKFNSTKSAKCVAVCESGKPCLPSGNVQELEAGTPTTQSKKKPRRPS